MDPNYYTIVDLANSKMKILKKIQLFQKYSPFIILT